MALRQPFTKEDDIALAKWLIEHPTNRSGQAIYKELERSNPAHSWQSWRERYVKKAEEIEPWIRKFELQKKKEMRAQKLGKGAGASASGSSNAGGRAHEMLKIQPTAVPPKEIKGESAGLALQSASKATAARLIASKAPLRGAAGRGDSRALPPGRVQSRPQTTEDTAQGSEQGESEGETAGEQRSRLPPLPVDQTQAKPHLPSWKTVPKTRPSKVTAFEEHMMVEYLMDQPPGDFRLQLRVWENFATVVGVSKQADSFRRHYFKHRHRMDKLAADRKATETGSCDRRAKLSPSMGQATAAPGVTTKRSREAPTRVKREEGGYSSDHSSPRYVGEHRWVPPPRKKAKKSSPVAHPSPETPSAASDAVRAAESATLDPVDGGEGGIAWKPLKFSFFNLSGSPSKPTASPSGPPRVEPLGRGFADLPRDIQVNIGLFAGKKLGYYKPDGVAQSSSSQPSDVAAAVSVASAQAEGGEDAETVWGDSDGNDLADGPVAMDGQAGSGYEEDEEADSEVEVDKRMRGDKDGGVQSPDVQAESEAAAESETEEADGEGSIGSQEVPDKVQHQRDTIDLGESDYEDDGRMHEDLDDVSLSPRRLGTTISIQSTLDSDPEDMGSTRGDITDGVRDGYGRGHELSEAEEGGETEEEDIQEQLLPSALAHNKTSQSQDGISTLRPSASELRFCGSSSPSGEESEGEESSEEGADTGFEISMELQPSQPPPPPQITARPIFMPDVRPQPISAFSPPRQSLPSPFLRRPVSAGPRASLPSALGGIPNNLTPLQAGPSRPPGGLASLPLPVSTVRKAPAGARSPLNSGLTNGAAGQGKGKAVKQRYAPAPVLVQPEQAASPESGKDALAMHYHMALQVIQQYNIDAQRVLDLFYCCGTWTLVHEYAMLLFGNPEWDEKGPEQAERYRRKIERQVWRPEEDEVVMLGTALEKERLDDRKGQGAVKNRAEFLKTHQWRAGTRKRYPFDRDV